MAATGSVQTVVGPVDPADLGITLPHEHLLDDLTKDVQSAMERGHRLQTSTRQLNVPEAGWVPGRAMHEVTASWAGKWEEPITLETLTDVSRNWVFHGSVSRLLSVEDAIDEVMRVKLAGGGCIVDATTVGMARDPMGLQRIALGTGIHIVMATGFYVEPTVPALADMSEDEMYEEIVTEIEEGAAGRVRPGLIGEVGLSHPATAGEHTSLRASARASADTGLPLSIHPGVHPDAPMEALRIVEKAGGDLSRTVMCHMEMRDMGLDGMLKVARTGCYVEYDTFGREATWMWQKGAFDIPNDPQRLNYMAAVAEAGHADQILMSQDVAGKNLIHKYGGLGYDHLIINVMPLMRHKGWEESLIERITVDNPAHMLTIA